VVSKYKGGVFLNQVRIPVGNPLEKIIPWKKRGIPRINPWKVPPTVKKEKRKSSDVGGDALKKGGM